MSTGFATALGEITLVLFTTLAPSGALAFVLMGAALLREQGEARVRINRFLIVPIFVSLIGLVASATHLGNPDNALYVFTQVGHSPLSNEVFAAVVFMGLAGVYWLYQFADRANSRVQRAWLVVAMVSAVAFVAAVAFAYAGRTIVTWNTPFVPVALCLNALVGDPVLAVARRELGACRTGLRPDDGGGVWRGACGQRGRVCRAGDGSRPHGERGGFRRRARAAVPRHGRPVRGAVRGRVGDGGRAAVP